MLTTLVFVVLLITPQPNEAVTNWNELAYDDDQAPESYMVLPENDSVAVRFSPPASNFKLTGINMYSNTTNLTKLRVWILNANLQIIMNPIIPSVALGLPPYEASFGDAGPVFTVSNVSDFYVVVQWRTSDVPQIAIGIDNTTPSGRSYTNQSGTWQAYTTGNIMIHTLIDDINGPTFDYIPLMYAVEGQDLSISVDVSDEFGVESVTLAYRTLGTNDSFEYTSLSMASGTPHKGIWFGNIPGDKIPSAGIEYYIWATDLGFNQRYYGNASAPFEVEAVQMFEMPLYGSILLIIGLCVAAVVLYYYLPEYKGVDTK